MERYQRLLTIDQAAARLSVHPDTVRRKLLKRGLLRGYKVMSLWRIDEADLVAYLEGARSHDTTAATAV